MNSGMMIYLWPVYIFKGKWSKLKNDLLLNLEIAIHKSYEYCFSKETYQRAELFHIYIKRVQVQKSKLSALTMHSVRHLSIPWNETMEQSQNVTLQLCYFFVLSPSLNLYIHVLFSLSLSPFHILYVHGAHNVVLLL